MSPTDSTLLERWIAHSDAEAFSALVSRHAGMVYGTCRRVLGNAADAEDATQECFLRLAASRSMPRTSFVAWLHAVASHLATDHLRSQVRRRARERRFAERRANERETSWEDLEMHVDKAIAELPDELRVVIVEHFLEGRTQVEISERLAVSRQSVGDRVKKGIERIRLSLKKTGIAVSATALSSLLPANLVESAPATLVSRLGKLSLAGPPRQRSAVTARGDNFVSPHRRGRSILRRSIPIAAASTLAVVGVIYWGSSRQDAEPLVRPPTTTTPSGPAGPDVDDRRRATTPEPERGVELEGQTFPSGSVRGRVVDAAGTQVARARVVAGDGTGQKIGEAQTTEDGRFSLEVGEAHSFRLHAFKTRVGLASSELYESDMPSDGEVVDLALEPLGHIEGRLFDRETGTAVIDVSMELSHYGVVGDDGLQAALRCLEVSGVRDKPDEFSAGEYSYWDLPPAKYLFTLDPLATDYVVPGYHGKPPATVVLEGGEARKVDFALERGGAISGSVFGPNGEGIDAAEIELVSSAHSFMGRFKTKSDAQGAYRFAGVNPGITYVVLARADGMAVSQAPPVALTAAEEVRDVDIPMVEGHSVFGRFVDQEEQAVPGVWVRLRRSYWNTSSSMTSDAIRTAASGSFVFEGVGPGEHQCLADIDGYDTSSANLFEMPPDRDLHDLVFVLKRNSLAKGSVSGRITDSEGRPLQDVRVSVHGARGGWAHASAQTAADGTYRADGLGEAKTLMVDVYPPEGFCWERRKDVPLNATDVDFALVRPARVEGRVVDDLTGEPVTNFDVRWISFRAPGEEHARDWHTVSSDAGEFVLGQVDPPETQIEVRAASYAPAKSKRLSIEPEEQIDAIELRLSPGARIRGRLIDAASGEPLAGVSVRVHNHGYFHSSLLSAREETIGRGDLERLTMSDSEGRFAFTGLPSEAIVDLVVWAQGYATTIVGDVAASVEPHAERPVPVAREAVLRVHVQDADGPATWIYFTLRQREVPEKIAYRNGAWLKPEMKGVLTFAGLPSGRYTLRLSDRDDRRALGYFQTSVTSGQTTQLDVQLTELDGKFGKITARVTGRVPIEEVWIQIVSAKNASDEYEGAGRHRDGAFELTGLPPGEYILRIHHNREVLSEVRQSVEGGGAHEVTIDLR